MNSPQEKPSDSSFPPSSRETEVNSDVIEDYLDHVLAPLVDRIPYARRQEMRSETRSHLLALVHSYRDSGHSEESAILQAIARFGSPRSMARQWLRTQSENLTLQEEFWQGIRTFGLALLGLLALQFFPPFGNPDDAYWSSWGLDTANALVCYCLLPLLAGLNNGGHSRRIVPFGLVGAVLTLSFLSLIVTVYAHQAGFAVPLDDPRGLPEMLLLWLPSGLSGYFIAIGVQRFSAFIARRSVAA